MKVRWSSTFIMLTRAVSRREVSTQFFCGILANCMVAQCIEDFIFKLGRKESNTEKRRKITALSMDDEEWMRVRLFCNILQVRTILLRA